MTDIVDTQLLSVINFALVVMTTDMEVNRKYQSSSSQVLLFTEYRSML